MTLVTEWFATRGENLVPSAERQSARVYVRNRGREVILRLDTSKGIGSPLPTMYIISIPTVNEFEADDQASTIKNHR